MKQVLRRPFIYTIALVVCLLTFAQCNGTDTKLKVLAKTFNLTAPMEVGPGVTLIKVEAIAGNEFKFYYEIASDSSNMINPVREKEIKNEMMQGLAESEDLGFFIDMKTTLSYMYQNAKGDTLFDFKIPYEKYSSYEPEIITTYDQLRKIEMESVSYLPVKIDNEIRIDSIVAHQPNILKYRYTMNPAREKRMNDTQWKQMRGSVLQSLMYSDDLAKLREWGTEFRYVYYNEVGDELGAFIFRNEDYATSN